MKLTFFIKLSSHPSIPEGETERSKIIYDVPITTPIPSVNDYVTLRVPEISPQPNLFTVYSVNYIYTSQNTIDGISIMVE